jgi:hypothetical protein
MARAPKDEFGTSLSSKVPTQDELNLARDKQVAIDAANAAKAANAARQREIDAAQIEADKISAADAAAKQPLIKQPLMLKQGMIKNKQTRLQKQKKKQRSVMRLLSFKTLCVHIVLMNQNLES